MASDAEFKLVDEWMKRPDLPTTREARRALEFALIEVHAHLDDAAFSHRQHTKLDKEGLATVRQWEEQVRLIDVKLAELEEIEAAEDDLP